MAILIGANGDAQRGALEGAAPRRTRLWEQRKTTERRLPGARAIAMPRSRRGSHDGGAHYGASASLSFPFSFAWPRTGIKLTGRLCLVKRSAGASILTGVRATDGVSGYAVEAGVSHEHRPAWPRHCRGAGSEATRSDARRSGERSDAKRGAERREAGSVLRGRNNQPADARPLSAHDGRLRTARDDTCLTRGAAWRRGWCGAGGERCWSGPGGCWRPTPVVLRSGPCAIHATHAGSTEHGVAGNVFARCWGGRLGRERGHRLRSEVLSVQPMSLDEGTDAAPVSEPAAPSARRPPEAPPERRALVPCWTPSPLQLRQSPEGVRRVGSAGAVLPGGGVAAAINVETSERAVHGGRIRAVGTAELIRWELGTPGRPCVVVHGRERVAA
jgi:hypothetical protein